MTTLLWILAVAMIVVGVAGTVLPALPGAVLVFGGIALAAWIDGFTEISAGRWAWWPCSPCSPSPRTTSRRCSVRRSRREPARDCRRGDRTLAGVFTGFVGLLFMPLLGAAIGEYVADRDMMRAGKVGVATWIGLLLGTAVKVALVFTMVGIFVAALLL